MKKLILSILISLCSIGISVAQKADQLKQTLEQNMNLMLEALDEGNAEKAASYFTVDALAEFPEQNFEGRNSVREVYHQWINRDIRLKITVDSLLVFENLAYELGTALRFQNNVVYDQGLYDVFWKEEDRQWKIWRWKGPYLGENTRTVPVQFQNKDIYHLENGISVSNNFSGARLNGAVAVNDTLIKILITPENTPINGSPWYAFKTWSDTKREVYFKFTYMEGFHRYYPVMSEDGRNWQSLDSTKVELIKEWVTRNGRSKIIPVEALVKLQVSSDTIWLAAQEVITSSDNESWIKKLQSHSFVTKSIIGQSHEGNELHALKIGEGDDKKMIFVISRQHPPEVTGYLAMRSFVETICSETETANNFRKEFNTYVIPMVNPDGVDNGHWRHNKAGVDLNRTWSTSDQPETAAIRDFVKQKVSDSDGKIYFFADFHSTWNDVYYTIEPDLAGNLPGLIPMLIKNIAEEFPDYEPRIDPSYGLRKIGASHYFFHEYGAESMTYEVGDNTPREFVKAKGRVTAEKLMELLLKESK